MKKIFTAFLLSFALLLGLPAAAFADTIPTQSGWTVTLTSKDKLESNFNSGEIAETLGNLQPGDDTEFQITVQNSSGKLADWYLRNEIIQSLEESQSAAKNGGYTYVLTYAGSDGTLEFYNSNRVGGGGQDGYSSSAPEGLNEIENALKDYIYMGRMNSGGSGVVTLKVALDGESQDNSYWNTEGVLELQFAVEIVPTNTRVVATGDSGVRLNAVYIGMAVAGFLVLGLAIDGVVQDRKKRKKGPAA